MGKIQLPRWKLPWRVRATVRQGTAILAAATNRSGWGSMRAPATSASRRRQRMRLFATGRACEMTGRGCKVRQNVSVARGEQLKTACCVYTCQARSAKQLWSSNQNQRHPRHQYVEQHSLVEPKVATNKSEKATAWWCVRTCVCHSSMALEVGAWVGATPRGQLEIKHTVRRGWLARSPRQYLG